MSPSNDHSETKATAAKAKARQAKKPRDMPSRPLSAYNFFFREERAKILEEREEEARRTGQTQDKSDLFAILGKTIAARWKQVSDEDRKVYKQQAADDMKRYRAEMDQYHESIAKSIRVDNKEGNSKKSSKKGSKKAAAVDDASASKGSPAVKPKSKNSPRQNATDLKVTPNGTPKASIAGQSANLAAMGAGNPSSIMGPAGGFGGVGQGASLEMLSYQNLLRQRELAALREQSMGMQSGLGPHGAMLRGGMGGGLGGPGLGYMDRLGAGAGPSAGFLGNSAGLLHPGLGGGAGGSGLLSPGYGASAAYPGLDMSMPEAAVRSGLTPEEQLFLLRRNQEEAELSVRQRLELMQQQRQMQLMDAQQQAPPNLAMMQERQRLLERQRLEQLLSGMGGPVGAPGAF